MQHPTPVQEPSTATTAAGTCATTAAKPSSTQKQPQPQPVHEDDDYVPQQGGIPGGMAGMAGGGLMQPGRSPLMVGGEDRLPGV